MKTANKSLKTRDSFIHHHNKSQLFTEIDQMAEAKKKSAIITTNSHHLVLNTFHFLHP